MLLDMASSSDEAKPKRASPEDATAVADSDLAWRAGQWRAVRLAVTKAASMRP